MAICRPVGFLAYNFVDLVPWGYIAPKLAKELPERPSDDLLDNPQPGVSYEEIPAEEEGEPSTWIEIRRQLPARRMIVEFVFRSRAQGNNINVNQAGGGSGIGFGFLGGGAGTLATTIANNRFLGGVSRSTNTLIYMVAEARTVFNLPLPITQEILDNDGEIRLPGYVGSVLIATKEPVPFTEDQRMVIGKPTHDTLPVRGIRGSNGSQEQFEGPITETLFAGGQAEFDAKNIYRELVQDERVYRFRADNDTNNEYRYAYRHNSANYNSLSSRTIRVDASGLEVGDVIYLTANLASKRTFRQVLYHVQTFIELPGQGPSTEANQILPQNASVDAWNYVIATWRVPKNVSRERVTLSEAFLDVGEDPDFDEVEGWRLAELGTKEVTRMYAADQRGIVLLGGNEGDTILLDRSAIRDQAWFDAYLAENGLENTTLSLEAMSAGLSSGAMFDLSPHVNSTVFDQEKIPYFRPFALSLSRVSAFVEGQSGTGVGIPNLDLETNSVANRDSFDLSSARFVDTIALSNVSSAFRAEPCAGLGSDGVAAYYDPSDPNNRITLIVPLPPAQFFIDNHITTPFLGGVFGRRTRVYVERFQPDGASTQFSSLYVRTFPAPDASLSVDTFPKLDESVAAFESDDDESIALHRLKDHHVRTETEKTEFYADGDNEEVPFVHGEFYQVGYNRLLGASPSYGRGEPISTEQHSLCTASEPSYSDLFATTAIVGSLNAQTYASRIVLNDAGGFEHEFGSEVLLRELRFEYSVPRDLGDEDARISVAMDDGSGGRVIDEFELSRYPGVYSYVLDGRLYNGRKITLYGSILSQLRYRFVSVVTTTRDQIEPYLVSGRQTATAVDKYGRLYVFFHDEESANISCAVSIDRGCSFVVYSDIIRLIGSEVADLPYVCRDKNSGLIHLFYRLNNAFLMYKPIDVRNFNCADLSVVYERPDIFTAESDDDLGIEAYSDQGKALRKQESYFVIGDASTSDEMQSEETISRQRFAANRSARYAFTRRPADMTYDFQEAQYCVFRDDRGATRIFWTLDGRLGMAASGDMKRWTIEFTDFVAHKRFADEELTLAAREIANPQVVFDEAKRDVLLFYFCGESLYVRRFSAAGLSITRPTERAEETGDHEDSPQDGRNGIFRDARLRSVMEVTANSPSQPVFLVGRIDPDVLQAYKDGSVDLLEIIPYPVSVVDQFDTDRFLLDTPSKPAAYQMRSGQTRVLYKAETGRVHGLTLEANLIPTLDVQRRAR